MTAREWVLRKYPRAEVVSGDRGFRVRTNAGSWGERTWLCRWCRTEERAWHAASRSMVSRWLDWVDE